MGNGVAGEAAVMAGEGTPRAGRPAWGGWCANPRVGPLINPFGGVGS